MPCFCPIVPNEHRSEPGSDWKFLSMITFSFYLSVCSQSADLVIPAQQVETVAGSDEGGAAGERVGERRCRAPQVRLETVELHLGGDRVRVAVSPRHHDLARLHQATAVTRPASRHHPAGQSHLT